MTDAPDSSEQAAVASLQNILPENSLSFGQTPDPEPEAAEPARALEPAPAAKPKYKVKVQGEEMDVDLDELLSGYSRQSDYTKKTQELATKQKEFEARSTELKDLDTYKQKITKYEQLLGDQVLADQQRDWKALLEKDPIEYLRQKELSEARAREHNELQAKRDQEDEERTRQTLRHEGEQLLAKRPEWKDEAVWDEDRKKLDTFLRGQGYRQDEIGKITDHRAIILADKSRRYDELMAQKEVTAKKIEKLPPKVERPGVPSASDGQSNREAMSRLKKSGSIDDAAAAIRSFMN